MIRLPFLLLLALLLWPLQAASPASAQQTRLRITLQLPISGHVGQNLVQFKTEVEAKSGGTISVEIFDNSRLYKDSEALGAVEAQIFEPQILMLEDTDLVNGTVGYIRENHLSAARA